VIFPTRNPTPQPPPPNVERYVHAAEAGRLSDLRRAASVHGGDPGDAVPAGADVLLVAEQRVARGAEVQVGGQETGVRGRDQVLLAVAIGVCHDDLGDAVPAAADVLLVAEQRVARGAEVQVGGQETGGRRRDQVRLAVVVGVDDDDPGDAVPAGADVLLVAEQRMAGVPRFR